MHDNEWLTSLKAQAVTRIEELPYPKIASGKVREIFDLGDYLLIVATDRLSAFDVILPDGIPGKGILLTQISLWWFARVTSLIDNHLAENHATALAEALIGHEALIPRSMLVRKLKPLSVEAVVRGYLAGSGWKVYRETGELWGQPIPANLKECSMLPQPLFTPTTKAETGHDLPLTPVECQNILGCERYHEVSSIARALYSEGAHYAQKAGLILADTKFEFGTDKQGKLYLIDEILTPDSSRYWPAANYQPGGPQHAYDKQYVRDYLESLNWNKMPPGPHLPPDVILQTQKRYLEAYTILTHQQ